MKITNKKLQKTNKLQVTNIKPMLFDVYGLDFNF